MSGRLKDSNMNLPKKDKRKKPPIGRPSSNGNKIKKINNKKRLKLIYETEIK